MNIVGQQLERKLMCLGFDAIIEGEEGDAGNEYASGQSALRSQDVERKQG